MSEKPDRHWIPADFPPLGNREVLIFVHDLGCTVAQYSTSEKKWFRQGGETFTPDYWMALPTFPRTDGRLRERTVAGRSEGIGG